MSDIHKNDEIDLLELFQKLINWFSRVFTWIGETLLRILLFYVRKSPWLIGFILLGVGVGYGIYKMTPRYYSTEMIIKANSISNSDLVHFINNVSMKGDLITKSNNFNMDTSEMKNIKLIKANWIIDINKDGFGDYVDYENTFNILDTTKSRIGNRLNIKVEVYDTSSIHQLTNGIIFYIENLDYFKISHENKIKQIIENLEKVEAELNELDSLQRLLYFQNRINFKENEKFLILNEKEDQLFHSQILNLHNSKQSYERILELYPEMVSIVQRFTPFSKAENNLRIIATKQIFYFLLFGIILLGVIRQLKFLKEFYRKY